VTQSMQSPRALRFRLAASCLLLFWFLGCQHAQQDHADRPRLFPGVRMQDVTFHSAALNRDMPYRVFLPAKVVAGQKLPVVYLLHGGDGGGFRDWSNDSDVAAYATRNLILVMPEGAFSYYMNAVGKPADRYEDYVLRDLIADVATRFPASDHREDRAIVGISMGGFAAIKWALSRPDLFVFVGALSPSVEVVHRDFSIRNRIPGIEEWWRLRTVFGPPGSEARRSSDPFVLVESARPERTPYMYVAVGEQERFLEPNRRFARRLEERKFQFEFHTIPGTHNWSLWDAQIPGCFDSLLQHLEVRHLELTQ
jgi:putative tributyrin esterase